MKLSQLVRIIQQLLVFFFRSKRLIIVVMTTILALSSGSSLECEFINIKVMKSKEIYKCKVQNLVANSTNETITTVFGDHKDNKASDDVEILVLQNQVCHHLPKNLDFHFPKVYHLDVHNSGLKFVASDDMKMFPKLRHLYIRNNFIEVLPENLFEHNGNLEFINLNDNKITQVGFNVFSSLLNLISISFERNPCFDGFAVEEDALKRLIGKVRKNCTASN